MFAIDVLTTGSTSVTSHGSLIVSGSLDSTVRIWDVQTGAKIAVLQGHKDAVESVAVTPDGRHIVSGSEDKTARIWDAETLELAGVLYGHLDSVMSIAVTPDSSRIVTGSLDNTARIWDLEEKTQLAVLKGHTRTVTSIAVTPDGSRILSGSEDKTVRIWDATTGAAIDVRTGHDQYVTSVAVTSDGSRIVSASWDRMRVWKLTPSHQALVKYVKDIAPRCLTAAQRVRYSLDPAPPRWCVAMKKWPYHMVQFTSTIATAVQDGDDADRIALNQRWRGEWNFKDEIFSAELDLDVSQDNTVSGRILWTVLSVPAYPKNREGLQGIEIVNGHFYPDANLLFVDGVDKDDPMNVIGLDQYRLVLTGDRRGLEGGTNAYRTWAGGIKLTR